MKIRKFKEAQKLHFFGFFNFEAIYLEGWLSKSHEILLVCKKKLVTRLPSFPDHSSDAQDKIS